MGERQKVRTAGHGERVPVCGLPTKKSTMATSSSTIIGALAIDVDYVIILLRAVGVPDCQFLCTVTTPVIAQLLAEPCGGDASLMEKRSRSKLNSS